MRRIFWFALGLGAGIAGALSITRRVRRQMERMSPAGVGRRAGRSAADAVGLVVDALGNYRSGAAEREAELRAILEGGRRTADPDPASP